MGFLVVYIFLRPSLSLQFLFPHSFNKHFSESNSKYHSFIQNFSLKHISSWPLATLIHHASSHPTQTCLHNIRMKFWRSKERRMRGRLRRIFVPSLSVIEEYQVWTMAPSFPNRIMISLCRSWRWARLHWKELLWAALSSMYMTVHTSPLISA